MYFGLTTAVGSLVVSNLEGPLADVRVRQALLMAIDREGILDAAAGGIGEVTDVLTTESVWVDADPAAVTTAFDDVDAYPYDLTAAKALVDEAGVAGEEIVIVDSPHLRRVRGGLAGDGRRSGIDRTHREDRVGHSGCLHGAVLRPGRARRSRPLLHQLVSLQP